MTDKAQHKTPDEQSDTCAPCSRPSDCYTSDFFHLHREDCMEGMKRYPDKHFELAIVDPPYGVRRDVGFVGFGGFGKPIARRTYRGGWDSQPPEQVYFNELLRVSRHQLIWGGNFYTDKLPQMNHWIFWDKINTMPSFGDGELCWTSFPRNSIKQATIEYNGLLGKEPERIHPTQKPVKLYEWLLKNYAKPGDKILDTHLGSGSSVIACYNMGHHITGFELDKEYFTAMRQRIEQHLKQQRLFDSGDVER